MTAQSTTTGDLVELVSQLVEAGNLDTVYRDVYVQRARALLAGAFSAEDFRRIERQREELAALPVAIGGALERGDWAAVKALSGRGDELRQAVEGVRRQADAARGIYAVTDLALDPFSPGLLAFTRLAVKDRTALRARAIERLAALETADVPWKSFYASRRAAFQALPAEGAQASATEAASADPREAAQRALKSGDMRGLAKLAEGLLAAAAPTAPGSAPSARLAAGSAPTAAADLLSAYSPETLAKARQLGLGARRLESRAEIASLRQYAWNPLAPHESARINLKQIALPAGAPEGFRERLEMLMIHPIVNSGGARHLPSLVAEDVLVEAFPDPRDGDKGPVSELLGRLGFKGRWALPRAAIEQALLDHGAEVVAGQLGLDPRSYRLVCIPPDAHLRLGEAEGWGRQPFWTHFDGYLVMAEGRLRALAGGDVRFGGPYDLVGIGRDYDSDRVMARFAVVRRERMVAW